MNEAEYLMKNYGDEEGVRNNLRPLFSGNEEHCISKEVKGNALASNHICSVKTFSSEV